MSDNPVTPDIKSYPYPSDRIWFDPRLILANCSVELSNVAITAGTNTNIAPARSNRWAIGFFQSVIASGCDYAPWPDVNAYVFDQSSITFTQRWYNLFDYGPIIANSWFARPTAPMTIRVVELLRN